MSKTRRSIPELAREAKEKEGKWRQEMRDKEKVAKELVLASKLLSKPNNTLLAFLLAPIRIPVEALTMGMAEKWGSWKCPECKERLTIEVLCVHKIYDDDSYTIYSCPKCEYRYATHVHDGAW